MSALPSVYDYVDYRVFLREWFDARKAADRSFSYRRFARDAGLSSPSLLVHVKKGERNLTERTTPAFAQALQLDEAASAHFELLVAFDQAATDELRQEAWEAIAATQHFRAARPIEGAAWACIANWQNAAVLELASTADFQEDPVWIAGRLRPEVTVAQVEEALAQLARVELLVHDDAGRLRPAEAALVTPPQVTGLAVKQYHSSMLAHASDSMSTVPAEERHIGGLTVAVPASLLPRLRQEVQAFERHLLNLCDNAGEQPDRVYQFGVQLFPLSHTSATPDDED